MRDAARLGFILMGLYFLISGISGLVSPLLNRDPVEASWFAISLFTYILPGGLLVAFNYKLAAWFFQVSGTPDSSSSSALVAGGLAVVAALLVLEGISACVGAVLALGGGWSSTDELLRPALVANGTFGLGRGLAGVVCGAALLRFARPIAERVARPAAS
jgi:hypothetical protein